MIQLDKFTVSEVEKFVKFSEEYYSLPQTNSKEFITWKFLGNTHSQSWHLKFIVKNKLVGRAVLNEKYINLHGVKYQITQVTDLLTSPNNKNILTFIKLIKNYKLLKLNGVFHTSNEKSDTIYSNLFKFKNIFSLTAFGFPLNFSKFIQIKYLKTIAVLLSWLYRNLLITIIKPLDLYSQIEVNDCILDENLNELLENFEKANTNFTRSIDFLKWRFGVENYGYKTKIIKINSEIIGIYVYKIVKFKNAKFFTIMDIIVIKEKINFTIIILLKIKILKNAIVEECDAIFGLLNKGNQMSELFLKFPFIKINDTMLPHATPLYVSSLNVDLVNQGLEYMYFSLADLDYF
jgi:hypothetical protein